MSASGRELTVRKRIRIEGRRRTVHSGTILFAFGLFVSLVLVYVVYRLLTDPPEPLEERSESLRRFTGIPHFFSSIFAKRLTKREKVGWLLYFVILLYFLHRQECRPWVAVSTAGR